ncbi:MAG: threonine-phosphate decarboxylase [Rhizobiales bacterium]|nr:threonine-phosphate decarboxylase [Hyphomicrobiales bacterium]
MDATPLVHGGDLDAARRRFPDAPQPFIDLSTGINPHPYPLPKFSSDVFTRLPEPAAILGLCALAAKTYGVPDAGCVVAAPGSQILLVQVASLVPSGRAAILGPTYGELARAAKVTGHEAKEVTRLEDMSDVDLAIIAHPNNPDGQVFARDRLLTLADTLRAHGGLLLVDEAFMDVGPAGASLAGDVARDNIVVLRSFGKFYGLAGLRLGFALAALPIAARLTAVLGPWAVSGPAIAAGEIALADTAWASSTRTALAKTAARLDQMLAAEGLKVIGGTPLFRLVQSTSAAELFVHLGHAGIFVRAFSERPDWLRFGIPGGETDWQRLGAAIATARQRP